MRDHNCDNNDDNLYNYCAREWIAHVLGMAAIKCVCLIAALLLLSATAVSAVSFGLRESTCTSSWAVKVNGGLERAKLIAANHGFEIREKVYIVRTYAF